MTSRERWTPKLNHSEIPKSTVGFIIMGKQYGSRCCNHTHNCWNSSSRASRGRKESHVCFSILFLYISLRSKETLQKLSRFSLGCHWSDLSHITDPQSVGEVMELSRLTNDLKYSREGSSAKSPAHTHTHTHTHTSTQLDALNSNVTLEYRLLI